MKKVFICAVLLVAFLFGTRESSLQGGPRYKKHRNGTFNYEIIVPARWQTDEVTLEKKHIFLACRGRHEIKVRAFLSENPKIDSVIHKRSWNLREIDPLLNRILETEKISVKKNVEGKLLVFEYRSHRKKMLMRTMVRRENNTIYIIDCKSPVDGFYRNEEAFNIALSSFKILSGGAENGQDESGRLEEEEGLASFSDGETDKDTPVRSGERKVTPKGQFFEEQFFEMD